MHDTLSKEHSSPNRSNAGEQTMVEITVDGLALQAPQGMPLLQACLENGIHIPNLCFLKGQDHPPASCRLCFVQVEGVPNPVASCRTPVQPGLRVQTDTPEVRRLQRTALQLLLSVHRVDCAHCPANKRCELQRTARLLKVKLKGALDSLLPAEEPDRGNPILCYHAHRCVLCGRCATVCKGLHGNPFLAFAQRGFETGITFQEEKDDHPLPCADCLACVAACPVAALEKRQKDPVG